MRTSDQTSIVIIMFCLLFHLYVANQRVIVEGAEVPAFDITSESLVRYMQLGDNINFDLPALYVFGDSIVDSGNALILNNRNPSLPYGIDFNHSTPTGRATNGRTIADFLAQVVGLPFPPAYLALSDTEKKTTRTGINYACGSSGILNSTNAMKAQGDRVLSLDEQIDYFESTVESLKCQFNSAENLTYYLSKSLFFVNTGNNDLGASFDDIYKNNFSNASVFVKYLSEELPKRLQKLYELGARKFFLNTAFPLGCTPIVLYLEKSQICEADTNERVSEYNKLLPDVLAKLQFQLPGSQFTLGNIYKVYMDAIQTPSSYGITKPMESCCMFCDSEKDVCSDRNERVFFDVAHPTEAMSFLIMKRFFQEPSLCSPVSLITLIQA